MSKEHKHSHTDLLMVYLTAMGFTPETISKELDMDEFKVHQKLQLVQVKELVKEKQMFIVGKDVRKRIDILANKSLDAVEEILKSRQEKASTKLQAATFLLDQAIGKAKQAVELSGSVSLVDFIRRAEQIRDVGPKQLAAPADPIDTFVDGYVQETITVGAKKS